MATSLQPNKQCKLELIVWCFIREKYENAFNFECPRGIKILMMHFSNKLIGCKMLTFEEDIKFFKLLSSKLTENIARCKFKLLYRASENKYLASTFHKFCDDHGPTITIIKSNFGNIFGGYTSIKWSSDWEYHKDKNAFLFVIRSKNKSIPSPKVFDCIDNECAVYHDPDRGPTFGEGHDLQIGDKCNKSLPIESITDWDFRCYTNKNSYNHNNKLCGADEHDHHSNRGHFFFKVVDYSVFEII